MYRKVLSFAVRILLLFFLLGLAYSNTHAEIKLETQLSDSVLILGDEIRMQLKVNGAQDGVDLDFPKVDGLSFRQLGRPSSSSQTIIVNGKINRFSGLVYNIGISAEKLGVFQVPGISVLHNHKTYTSQPFRLRVRAQDQISNMKVITAVSSKKIYLHQPLIITLKWYIQDDIEEYAFRFSLLDRKDELGLKLRETQASGNSRNINVNSYRIPFIQSKETLKGEQYTTYEVNFEVYPAEAGNFRIPSASVKAAIKTGFELGKDFFGRTVRTPKLKQIFNSSTEILVKVQELPLKDRPVTFTGAVGKFTIHISTEVSTVKVGDPIDLTFRIRGEGRFVKIEQPVLSELPEYKNNFVIVDNLQPGDIQDDGVQFKQVIRPRHDDISSIPPVKFSFFDPEKEDYVTIESNSLALKVLPAKQVTEADIVIFDDENRDNGNNVLTKKESGLYAIYTFEDALIPQTQSWSWYFLLLLPPLIYFSALALTNRHQKLHNNSALKRAKSANTSKNKQMKAAKQLINADGNQIYQELSRILTGYIADRLNLGTGELTTIDIRRLNKEDQLPIEIAERLSQYLQDFDRLRFTNQNTSLEEKKAAYTSVDRILKELGKIL